MLGHIQIPNSKTPTSQLGLGCASLTGGLERKSALKLIDVAYEAGIRHFDVAPPYGIGTAEDVLGEALQNRRSNVSIATKVGISRPRLSRVRQIARMAAQPVRSWIPVHMHRRAQSILRTTGVHGQFEIPAMRVSFEESLRLLRTEYVDMLFVHEAAPGALTDEVLVFLQDLRASGAAAAIGLATSVENLCAVPAGVMDLFDTVQYHWDVFTDDSILASCEKFRVTNRVINPARKRLGELLKRDGDLCNRLCDATGMDLQNPAVLVQVLLAASIARHPIGITLAGTRRADRVTQYAAVLSNHDFVKAGAALNILIKSEVGSNG